MTTATDAQLEQLRRHAHRGATYRVVDRLGAEHVGRIYASGGGVSPIVESDDSRLGKLLRLVAAESLGVSVLMFMGDHPAVLGGPFCRSVTITGAKSIELVVADSDREAMASAHHLPRRPTMTTEILTDTPNGPQVEYGNDDASDVEAVASEAGWRVDWETPAVRLASGRYRAPLVRPTIAVLDVRGERRDSTPRRGRIVSLHETPAEAEQAREQEIDRQLGDARSVRDAAPEVMWAIGEVDAGAQIGDRVAFTAVRS